MADKALVIIREKLKVPAHAIGTFLDRNEGTHVRVCENVIALYELVHVLGKSLSSLFDDVLTLVLKELLGRELGQLDPFLAGEGLMKGVKLAVAPFHFPRGTLLALHPQGI